jgi:hypothetical protein
MIMFAKYEEKNPYDISTFFFNFLSSLSEFLWFLNNSSSFKSSAPPLKNFPEKICTCYTLLDLFDNKPIFFDYCSSYSCFLDNR